MKNLLRSRPLNVTKFCATLAFLLTILAQTGCTIGPTTEVRYVIVHPGQPLRVMESATVEGERLDGGGVTKQNVSGWVMMPPDHWDVISAELKRISAAKISSASTASTPNR